MTTNWTKVPKATGTVWTKKIKPSNFLYPAIGSPIGLLLALTYATSLNTTWTKVPKATGTVWTKLPKAS